MFTQEHLTMELKGMAVQDALTMMQLIRRLVKSGVMEDIELAPVTEVRTKLVRLVQEATGVNYDVAFAQANITRSVAVSGINREARRRSAFAPAASPVLARQWARRTSTQAVSGAWSSTVV